MELKVIAVGDALAAVLPDQVRERLTLAEGSTLLLADAPDGYLMTGRISVENDRTHVARGVMERSRNALDELAKSR